MNNQATGKPPLKIGLLLEDYEVAAWTFQMIEDIQSSGVANIELVVLNRNEKPQENKTLLQKITRNKGRWIDLAIQKFLELTYSKVVERNTYVPYAEEPQDSRPLLKDATILEVTTNRKTWSDYFHDADIGTIQKHNIDILVRCGFGILRGEILNVAKYGIWSLHHGDNFVNRGGPAGYWESMQSWPETGAILQILSEDLDNGLVLYRSFSCTDSMSYQDNISNSYWKSLFFITRKIRELHTLGAEEFFARVDQENQHPVFYSERLYKSPTTMELAKLTFGRVKNKLALQFKNKFRLEQWILLFHMKDDFSSSLWRYKKITPPKDRFWADPFVVQRDGKYYIFIEELIYAENRGFISLIVMDEDGSYSDPVPVLKRDYHLSYPYIFEHEGKTYMIPESMENKTIELYECTNFPHEWQFKYNLMEDIEAVDATLHFHNDKWWLFAGVKAHAGMTANDELCIYHADSPLSTDWEPHCMNPVISDCKLARPAGKIYQHNGQTYRPSQNCSHHYGYGFNLSVIDVLTETQYKETTVSQIKPNWEIAIKGTHTFNRVGRLHIIDALYERKR